MDYSNKVLELWTEEARAGRIFIHDYITPEIGIMVASSLDRCERDKNIEEVTVDVSSYGGSVDVSFQIIDRIRSMKTPVNTFCSGTAMSGGFLILAAGRNRKSLKHSSLMFHGCARRSGYQKAPDIQNEADYTKRIDDAMCEYLGSVTKMKPKHWQAFVKAKEDRYVTPQEALEWGVIDEIVSDYKA